MSALKGSAGSGASQATSSGKRATRASWNEKRGMGREEGPKVGMQPVVDLLRRHEGKEERDVRRNAVLGRPVVFRTPLLDERLGFRDLDDQGAARHEAKSTLRL